LRENHELQVNAKSAYDHVTSLDIAVERYLSEALRAAVPGASVIGEELGVVQDGAVTWYLDPIDGTGNFARGIPLAVISIGVAVAGELVGGCVYDPFRDELFAGGVGHPTRVESPWPVWGSPGLSPPMVVTDLPRPGRSRPAELAFLDALAQGADLRRIGASALALAWVAAGRATVACNLPIAPWDVAAGAALVRAAGGRFVPIGVGAGEQDEAVRAEGFVAATAGNDDLVDWIATQLSTLAADNEKSRSNRG
jgi:myo-inositol-1(or 4)-monophosphatase